jgi:hypothetical protein
MIKTGTNIRVTLYIKHMETMILQKETKRNKYTLVHEHKDKEVNQQVDWIHGLSPLKWQVSIFLKLPNGNKVRWNYFSLYQ